MYEEIVKGLFGVDLVPVQADILDQLMKKDKVTSMLIMPEGGGKNLILGIYSILECITNKSYRIAVMAPTFRISKDLYEHTENLLKKSCIKSNSIHDADEFKISFPNESTIKFLPLSDGSKIRGNRPNCLIVLGLSSIDKDIFETIIAGFSIVSENPNRLILTDFYENIKYQWVNEMEIDDSVKLISVNRKDYPEGFWYKNV